MADTVEDFITEAVLYRLDTPHLAAALDGPPTADATDRLQAGLGADQQQLEELAAGLRAEGDHPPRVPRCPEADPVSHRHRATRI